MVLHYRLEDSNILDKYQDSNNVELCLFLDFESRVLLGLMALVEALEGICLGGATVDQSDVDPSIVTYANPKGVLNLREHLTMDLYGQEFQHSRVALKENQQNSSI